MSITKNLLNHLLPIAIFFVLVSIYFGPLYTGKTLVQSDNVQLSGVTKEVADYKAKGEQIHWNNKEFSGVPLQSSSSYGIFKYLNGAFFYSIIPKPIAMIFFLFLGFYLLMQVLGVSKWLSAIGAMAYAFSSFNIISVEVGHDNKVLAMAFIAPVIAGVISAYRGDILKGAIITAFGAGFQLYYGHIQITYYTLIIVLAYLILVIYKTTKDSSWNQFFKASGALAGATVIAFGCNFTKLASTLEYADYSTRGGSELKKGQSENVSSEGLDKDYALSWSSGKMEAFTLLFPYFHGGASSERVSESSEVYRALSSRGVDRRTIDSVTANLPLYWGTQPFTGGPIYFGAITCFLFILALFTLKGPLKWWGLGLTILSLLLAMGKNLEWFTDIFFYYVPLYNKFRSVTMIFSIAQFTMPFLGIVVLDKILKEELEAKEVTQKVIQAAGIILGLGIIFILFKSSFFDFRGQNDAAYGFPQWLVDAVVSDRKRLFTNDIIRSMVFVALAAGALWLYLKKTIKLSYAVAALAILVLVDLWAVNKRYLGEDDFQSKRRASQAQFQPTQADQQILQDKDYYRVLNLTSQNPFSDGLTSYHHYSVLGYSAIKMQRYQELIDRYFRDMDTEILGMLNTKYFIVKGQNGPQVQRNPNALGNVWLVNELKKVANADEEIAAVGNIDLAKEAAFDQRFSDIIDEANFTADGTIILTNYHPEEMTYSFSSNANQFAVFSEIFYDPGWNAYIDGDLADHVRVNYVLRGLEIPKGKHEVVFKYEPISQALGTKIVIFCSLLLLIGLAFTSYKLIKE